MALGCYKDMWGCAKKIGSDLRESNMLSLTAWHYGTTGKTYVEVKEREPRTFTNQIGDNLHYLEPELSLSKK
jgi:hypothetical protein